MSKSNECIKTTCKELYNKLYNELYNELLEELQDKQFNTIVLNGLVQEITESKTDIHDYDRENWENSFCWEHVKSITDKNILISYDILNPENENDLEIIVKVTDIDWN